MADSPGARLVQEWQSDWDKRDEAPMWHIEDLARRIDAALAEQAEATGVLWEQTSEAMKAKLAEREAQIAQAPTREMLLKMNTQLEANAVGLTQMLADQQAEVARLTEGSRTMGRVAAEHVTKLTTERDALRAALQALADAADARLHDPNWIPLMNARRVLAAGEK